MNKNIIKILVMLLSAVMMLSFISCSKNDKDLDEDIVGLSTPVPVPEELVGSIVFSSYRNDDNEVAHFNFMQSFVMQYPSVDVEMDLKSSAEEYFSTLAERIENGTIGDVFVIDAAMIAEYAEKDLIVDLTKYSDGVIDFTSDNYEKLYPSKLFFPAAYSNSLYDGHMYMCPVEYNNNIVFLNLDMMEAIGIDPVVPDDSWTWQDIEEIAEKLAQAGYTTPIVMDYSDYSIWGAFARSKGAQLFETINFAGNDLALKLTNPDVLSGIEYLTNNFIRKGYIAEKKPADLSAQELSNYAMVVCSHADIVRWGADLVSIDNSENAFEWEFAHFPGFYDEETDTTIKSIGVQTLGLAVYNQAKFNEINGVYDKITDEELLKEEKENVENTIQNSITFSLFAMVEEAAVALTGEDGYRVPALMSANSMKYWRKYPIDGKNTSVFSLYNQYDFAGELTSFILYSSANEIIDSVGEAISKYASDLDAESIDKYIQEIQDAANTH